MYEAESKDLERKSCAVTLSDMEVFIFPELIYSLVLANIMSPRLWSWRNDPWFAGIGRMKPQKRIMRLKQFIMDHYAFNLDLDTWGLTTKEKEMARFRDFISEDTLRQSNALFGYEGDKYYFDIDIRTHFGLNKYEGNVIPYWKTETVEAMDAFRFKPNYPTGAGECVSLATLYAAALFIVAGIPLKDIYLMATPLHSQNFVDVQDGVLTNNRRLVTRNMWFNGTALSDQARRALENERVTIVAHETGVVHAVYDEASIDRGAYEHFSTALCAFLRTDLTSEILGNFLRHSREIQRCFQLRWPRHGVDHYVGLEGLMKYEEGSPYRFTDHTRPQLMAEIESEEFVPNPLPGRMVINDLEAFVRDHSIDIHRPADVARLKEQFASTCLNAELALESLCRFCRLEPRLPDAASKTFVAAEEPLKLTGAMSREEIIARLESVRGGNRIADLAFHAFRDLGRTEPEPFLKAAIERSPVSLRGLRSATADAMAAAIEAMPGESIYDDGTRLAQPDEVWNFQRGDGLEKAVLLANLLRTRMPDAEMTIDISASRAALRAGSAVYTFASSKTLGDRVWTIPA